MPYDEKNHGPPPGSYLHTVRLLQHEAELAAPIGDHIGRELSKGVFYEHELLVELDKRIGGGRGGVVVDVGAHLGNHTVAFLKMGVDHVLAFEPNPRMFSFLVCNAVRNGGVPSGLPTKVRICLRAAHDEHTRLFLHGGPPGNSGMARCDEVRGGMKVPCSRVDDELERTWPDKPVVLIKVDVEGMEVPALKSALRTIERDQPIIVAEAATLEHFGAINDFLSPLGYASDAYAWGARTGGTPTYLWAPTAAA